jgi:hypothetical protein
MLGFPAAREAWAKPIARREHSQKHFGAARIRFDWLNFMRRCRRASRHHNQAVPTVVITEAITILEPIQ